MGRGWVAAGIGHDICRGHPVGVELGQSVDGFGQELLLRVFDLVPRLVDRSVVDAEVGGKIDNLDSALMELSQHVHGLAVGDGEEDHVAKLFSCRDCRR